MWSTQSLSGKSENFPICHTCSCRFPPFLNLIYRYVTNINFRQAFIYLLVQLFSLDKTQHTAKIYLILYIRAPYIFGIFYKVSICGNLFCLPWNSSIFQRLSVGDVDSGGSFFFKSADFGQKIPQFFLVGVFRLS